MKHKYKELNYRELFGLEKILSDTTKIEEDMGNTIRDFSIPTDKYKKTSFKIREFEYEIKC